MHGKITGRANTETIQTTVHFYGMELQRTCTLDTAHVRMALCMTSKFYFTFLVENWWHFKNGSTFSNSSEVRLAGLSMWPSTCIDNQWQIKYKYSCMWVNKIENFITIILWACLCSLQCVWQFTMLYILNIAPVFTLLSCHNRKCFRGLCFRGLKLLNFCSTGSTRPVSLFM